MKPDLSAIPRLAPGVRLNEKAQLPRLLLTPGRSFRLHGPSLEIIELCDGTHTVEQIAQKLQALYRKAEPERVTADLQSYLELLHRERAIEF